FPVVPVKVMVPNPEAVRVALKIRGEPVRCTDCSLCAELISRAGELVVIRQAPLGDGDGVVLLSDGPAIAEQWNAGRVVWAVVVGLFTEEHEVFAAIGWCRERARVDCRRFVPESELAGAGAKVDGEDAMVVMPAGGQTHAEECLFTAVTGQP